MSVTHVNDMWCKNVLLLNTYRGQPCHNFHAKLAESLIASTMLEGSVKSFPTIMLHIENSVIFVFLHLSVTQVNDMWCPNR